MALSFIEAVVGFGGLEWTLDGVLHRLVHVRSWETPTSYIMAEVANPHTEIINEFMNYGEITVQYGKDGEYTDQFKFEIISVEHVVEFSNIKIRIYAVEKGFVRLMEQTRIQSFQGTTVAKAVAKLVNDAGINTRGMKDTIGNFTFIQPNVSDMKFISEYMVPIATDSAKTSPFLFTIDNNICYLRPPNLTSESKFNFIIDPSNETVVKKFVLHNGGVVSDFLYGDKYKAHAYDPINSGTITIDETRESVTAGRLNQIPYKSGFNAVENFPYEQPWMSEAHMRNNLGRSNFVVSATATIAGEVEFIFDQIYQFTMEAFQKEQTEYSGKYYVYGVTNTLMRRFFTSTLSLHSNSFLKGEEPSSPRAEQALHHPNRAEGGVITAARLAASVRDRVIATGDSGAGAVQQQP